jgi:hypothetical protein
MEEVAKKSSSECNGQSDDLCRALYLESFFGAPKHVYRQNKICVSFRSCCHLTPKQFQVAMHKHEEIGIRIKPFCRLTAKLIWRCGGSDLHPRLTREAALQVEISIRGFEDPDNHRGLSH